MLIYRNTKLAVIEAKSWDKPCTEDLAQARRRERNLLTLATGTGKTAIAFQIAWKLFQSRWNLADWKGQGEPGLPGTRRPRILFLADRNILTRTNAL